MKRIFVVMVAVLTMVVFAGNGMAQKPAKPAEPAKAVPEKKTSEKAKSEKPKAMRGTVAAYDAGKMIRIKGKDKETPFDITGDTRVKGDIKEGAKVTVFYKKDGERMVATSISATPEKKRAPEKK